MHDGIPFVGCLRMEIDWNLSGQHTWTCRGDSSHLLFARPLHTITYKHIL